MGSISGSTFYYNFCVLITAIKYSGKNSGFLLEKAIIPIYNLVGNEMNVSLVLRALILRVSSLFCCIKYCICDYMCIYFCTAHASM